MKYDPLLQRYWTMPDNHCAVLYLHCENGPVDWDFTVSKAIKVAELVMCDYTPTGFCTSERELRWMIKNAPNKYLQDLKSALHDLTAYSWH